MMEGRGDRKKQKYQLWLPVIIVVIICFIEFVGRRYTFSGNDRLQILRIEGETKEANLTATQEGHFTEAISPGKPVYLRIQSGQVEIEKNGQTVFSQKSQTDDANGDFLFSSEWMQFASPGFSPEDRVTVRVSSENADKNLRLLQSNFYAGDRLELLKVKMMEKFHEVMYGIFIVMLGTAHLISVLTLRGMKREITGGYPACGILLICGGLSTLLDYTYVSLVAENLNVVTNIDYLLQGLVCICLLAYLRSFSKSKAIRRSIAIFMCLAVGTIFLYYFLRSMRVCTTEECIMWQYPISSILITASLVLLGVEYRQTKNRRERRVLLSSGILSVLTVVEIVHFCILQTYWNVAFQMGLLMFAYMQFVILIGDAQERLREGERMERELAQSRISIMLSQIQPHFLYNTLSAIAYLCEKDPKQARKATEAFAGYLRGNMDSLKHRHPILFSTELKHLEVYLSLEKLRFEDELNIVYDIQATDFMLPALTVQPLVENAVKYGVGKAENGGTVTIRTREEADGYRIIVEDDGVGYNPYETQEDGRTHIGIDNVKSRLESMSNGTLDIVSKKGIGTTATIWLPKGRNKE